MSILITQQTRSLPRMIYKDIAMYSAFNRYLDDLISDKATKDIHDGWHLSTYDLTDKELQHLSDLQEDFGSLQDLIDERCNEKYHDWRNSRGFNE